MPNASPEFATTLAALPDADFPRAGGEVVRLRTPDAVELRAAFWAAPADQPAAGTVLLLQGRAEFIEKYGEVISELGARGYATATFDWRGQGGSERQLRDRAKGHVEDFDDYRLDLETAIGEMTRRAMPQPWTILAHSTGGAIALLHVARGPSPFRRVVTTAPLAGVFGWAGGAAAQFSARAIAGLGFARILVPGGTRGSRVLGSFEGNPFTRDAGRYARMQAMLRIAPSLSIGDPTVGWVAAAFDALDAFAAPDFGEAGRTPVLMLIAGADAIVSSRAAEDLARRMRGASAITLPGARHEILMETDETRRLFWHAFDAFAARAEVTLPAPEAAEVTT